MATLNPDQLRRLARLGAVARLEQLRQEEAAIRGEFPELFGRGRREEAPQQRQGGRKGGRAAAADGQGTARKRGGRSMSAKDRKAVSERMRRYWAERRKAKAAS